ncbi:MAG: DEAD/DEAH box helicase family protein [Microcoleaceae cyanobacterium]
MITYTKQLALLPKAQREPITLRPYQEDLKAGIYRDIRNGIHRILIYAPTGAGKTLVFCSVIADACQRGKRILLLVHRDFLVHQTLDKMEALGICPDDVGIIKAEYPENRDRPIQIASVLTLQNRTIPQADIVIVDEAHTICFYKLYEQIIEQNPKAIQLGFSASPWRMKPHKEYFGLYYDSIVRGPSIAELIKQGYLSQIRPFGWGGILDYRNIGLDRKGDFNKSKMQQAFIDQNIHLDVRDKILELCEGRTGIIFNAGKRQSEITTDTLNKAGIPTAHVCDKTSFKDRRIIFDQLARGEIRCISSIGCLTEGFDVASISFIVFARATKSKALYFQIAGRGIRPAPGKKECIIIDFGKNVERHGSIREEQQITLDPTEKKDGEAPVKECPGCHAMVPIQVMICPECGYEFPPKEKEEDKEFDKKFGELFDPETKKIVSYCRGQRKNRFTRNLPPDPLWENFKVRYPDSILHAEWLLGSAFGIDDTEANRQKFLEYLTPHAPNNYRRDNWLRFHMNLEFGQPGRTYRVASDEYKTAKIGSTTQLDWWEILQVPPTADLDMIKNNYQELTKAYSQLDEKAQKEKITLLNWALEKARSQRTEQLELM